jgi:hypothetical protein
VAQVGDRDGGRPRGPTAAPRPATRR